MNKTTFILGMSKSLDDNEIKERKTDLMKIRKYLIRQTHTEDGSNKETPQLEYFNNLTFIQYLHDVGMFDQIVVDQVQYNDMFFILIQLVYIFSMHVLSML